VPEGNTTVRDVIDWAVTLCGFMGDASWSACLCETTFLVLLQDECREFRDLFKNGKLSCTRENDPVRDSSGKQHSNKCIMCAEKL